MPRGDYPDCRFVRPRGFIDPRSMRIVFDPRVHTRFQWSADYRARLSARHSRSWGHTAQVRQRTLSANDWRSRIGALAEWKPRSPLPPLRRDLDSEREARPLSPMRRELLLLHGAADARRLKWSCLRTTAKTRSIPLS